MVLREWVVSNTEKGCEQTIYKTMLPTSRPIDQRVVVINGKSERAMVKEKRGVYQRVHVVVRGG